MCLSGPASWESKWGDLRASSYQIVPILNFCFSWCPSRILFRLRRTYCNLYHGLSRSRLKYEFGIIRNWWPILHSWGEDIFGFAMQFLCAALVVLKSDLSHAFCWNLSRRLTNVSLVGPGHCTQILYSLSSCPTFNCFESDQHACSSVLLATLLIRLISHALLEIVLLVMWLLLVPQVVLQILNGFFTFVLSRVTSRDLCVGSSSSAILRWLLSKIVSSLSIFYALLRASSCQLNSCALRIPAMCCSLHYLSVRALFRDICLVAMYASFLLEMT